MNVLHTNKISSFSQASNADGGKSDDRMKIFKWEISFLCFVFLFFFRYLPYRWGKYTMLWKEVKAKPYAMTRSTFNVINANVGGVVSN